MAHERALEIDIIEETPERLSYNVTRCRYAALALLLTIMCEMIEGNIGLGFYMAEAMGNYLGSDIAALMIILALVAVALDRMVAWTADRLARWLPVTAAAPSRPARPLPSRASDSENRNESRPA